MEDSFSPWDPLIQLEPCNWGSINKGHLEQEEMTAAFSKLIESAGSPSFLHLALTAYVVRIFNGSIPSVIGICLDKMSGIQMSFQSPILNLAEKAPIYETKADANSTSPITFLMLDFSYITFSPQRLFSPANPFTSFSAAVNLFWQFWASSSTILFCSSASANCFLRPSTISFSFLTYSLTLAKLFMAISRSSLALSLASSRGRTSL